MASALLKRKIYHLTHVENLASIVGDAELVSDSTMITRGGPSASVGMSSIKQRRMTLSITCHAGTTVGQYVPFYFCPRSVMLFVLHRANHPDLQYRGGQDPMIHLEADLQEVVAWADRNHRHWAFSLSNAGARYATFCATPKQLDQVNWAAIEARDFRDPTIKEGKQAEFLVEGSFPWSLVKRIGVHSQAINSRGKLECTAAIELQPVEIQIPDGPDGIGEVLVAAHFKIWLVVEFHGADVVQVAEHRKALQYRFVARKKKKLMTCSG